jgi:hypothetical protein
LVSQKKERIPTEDIRKGNTEENMCALRETEREREREKKETAE